MKKIGIFAGTFDPVHEGHLAFALAALNVSGLDKVFFLVEALPRKKTKTTLHKHRLAMLKQALKPFPKLGTLELNEKQFSVGGTLPKLTKRFAKAQLFMLVGSDVLKALPNWPGAKDLLDSVQLISGERQPRKNQKRRPDVTTIYTSFGGVSSTKIRDQLAKSKLPHGLPTAVATYIKKHQLYN